MAKMWDPWRGCHKIAEGCENCYIHIGDSRKGIDTNKIYKTEKFDLPVQRKKNGEYKINSGELIYVCFSSDFLLEKADEWRVEAWKYIKERQDLEFLFLTKRIKRFIDIVPDDWGEGYNNVTVGVSVSTQNEVETKISELSKLPIKHKNVILQPLIEDVEISKYLDDVELVVLGGEYGASSRELHYDWVLNVREQCISKNVSFEFRQCATNFVKEGKKFKLKYKELTEQAKKANINWKPQN
jgi:protein gp37